MDVKLNNGDKNDCEKPSLDETNLERTLTAILQVAGSALPPLGAVSGLLLQKLSGRRLDRFKLFIETLDNEIKNLEQLFRDQDSRLNLVEEGLHHALKSYSKERIEYIAAIVANGISGKDKEEAEANRMLRLLSELEDDQVIVLASYLNKNKHNKEFRETHASVLEHKIDYVGGGIERSDAAEMQQAAKQQLVRLKLLKPIFKMPHKSELPEFDTKTGMIKLSHYDITWLGSMLLRYLGLAEPGEL